MAKGEKQFSTQGREARRFESKPFPEGDYQLKVLGETFEIRKPEPKTDKKTGKLKPSLPYINGAYEVLGTGQEGGKNRRVYGTLFLSQKPSDKDGSVMSDRADQLVGLARALGEELEGIIIIEVQGIDVIGPKGVLAWIKAHDGAVINAHVKISKERTDPDSGKTYSARNEIEFFIPSEEGGLESEEEDEDEETEEGEEESDSTEDTDETEDAEDEDEESDTEETEEEEEAPKKKSSKPVQKKVVKKKGKR